MGWAHGPGVHHRMTALESLLATYRDAAVSDDFDGDGNP